MHWCKFSVTCAHPYCAWSDHCTHVLCWYQPLYQQFS